MWLKFAKGVYTLFPLARQTVFGQVAQRVIPAHEERALKWGVLHRADWSAMAQQHDVATTFILGSGYSIKEYSNTMFAQIRSGWSIALNAWREHHAFRPDVLMIETFDRCQWRLLAQDAPSSNPFTILTTRFGSIHGSPTPTLSRVPDSLSNVVRGYVALPMLGLSPSSYASYMSHLLELADCYPHVAGPNRTSVERAVVIAALAGAQEVVLCGIDLSGPPFWDSSPAADRRPHGTDGGRAFRQSVARRIPVLAEVLNSRLGTTVTLGLEFGPLAGVLPLHAWNCVSKHQDELQ